MSVMTVGHKDCLDDIMRTNLWKRQIHFEEDLLGI